MFFRDRRDAGRRLAMHMDGYRGRRHVLVLALLRGGVAIGYEIARSLNAYLDVFTEEALELERRESLYRRGREFLKIENKTVILVADGLATGASMMAAIVAVKSRRPKSVIVAIPVAAKSTLSEIANMVDHAVCLQTPEPFWSVGSWYADFTPTSDQEVQFLLDDAARNWAAA